MSRSRIVCANRDLEIAVNSGVLLRSGDCESPTFSRHSYVEFVFDQEVDIWLRCHRRAFEWYGGAVRRVVLDNLKAAIVH
jgi:hypothetical protein